MARKRKSQGNSELEKMITSCKTFDEFFVLSVVSLLMVKMFQLVINPAFDGEEEARIVSNVSTESSNGSLLSSQSLQSSPSSQSNVQREFLGSQAHSSPCIMSIMSELNNNDVSSRLSYYPRSQFGHFRSPSNFKG